MNLNLLRDRTAGMAVAVLRRLQRTVQYRHRGEDAITIYADWNNDQTSGGEMLSAETEEHARTFFIPRQDNFPPTAGIAFGDLIIVDSREYRVLHSDDGGL